MTSGRANYRADLAVEACRALVVRKRFKGSLHVLQYRDTPGTLRRIVRSMRAVRQLTQRDRRDQQSVGQLRRVVELDRPDEAGVDDRDFVDGHGPVPS